VFDFENFEKTTKVLFLLESVALHFLIIFKILFSSALKPTRDGRLTKTGFTSHLKCCRRIWGPLWIFQLAWSAVASAVWAEPHQKVAQSGCLAAALGRRSPQKKLTRCSKVFSSSFFVAFAMSPTPSSNSNSFCLKEFGPDKARIGSSNLLLTIISFQVVCRIEAGLRRVFK
jgi:hypothetical protein